MCNAFNTARKPEEIKGSMIPAKTRLIRRTDPAPVILPSGEITTMRWGFERKGLGTVNNTRSDNLESPMWRESIAERRCLIPVASYYEWTGSTGHKKTHLFRDPENNWLKVAGIWEESKEHGLCFSMLTTDASAFAAPIHHRMPAILGRDDQERFLSEGLSEFSPSGEPLTTEVTVNPLLKNPPTHIQEELF